MFPILTFYFFSVVQYIETPAEKLNSDWKKVSEIAFQWKVNFIPNFIKQKRDFILTQKLTKE